MIGFISIKIKNGTIPLKTISISKGMKSKMKIKHILTALLGIVFIISALYAIAFQKADDRLPKADIIVINSMKLFGDLERPGVSFPHDRHTDALEKLGKDCTNCHLTDGDKQGLKFKRTEEIDYQTSLDIYHTDCIGCHEENTAADLETGPVECGECHQQKPELVPGQQAIDFDASIHHRHIEAANNKCESCHHGYDADEKKVVYEKGKEESCRACHKKEAVDNVISYQSASHQSCISCHQQEKGKTEFKNTAVANLKCSGCHDNLQLKKIAKLDKIPRLDRNQPDTTFVKSFDDMIREMIDPVVFDHQRHEETVSSCSTCHHETLNSCESCHTLSGSEEGKWITLAQAMHNTNSDRSCVGCHAQEQKEKRCAGCHSLMDKKTHVPNGQSCQSCHSVPLARLKADKRSGRKLQAKRYKASKIKQTQVNYKAFPENIVIDVISTEYQGVVFPHKLIVESLMDKIEDNVLATNFHQGKDLICQSCHHNSPGISNPPPKCITCHSLADNGQDDFVPGIKAAYHRQCFECHEKMEIKEPVSTDCIACHKEK